MDLCRSVFAGVFLACLVLLSPGVSAAEKINIFELKNNIDELQKFSTEIDSYLAGLKSQGYAIDAEEKIWNTIKGLISDAKKEYDAKNYYTAQRLVGQIGPLYDSFRSGLESEDNPADLKEYVTWINENQQSIDAYLDNLTGQGYDVADAKSLWTAAKQLYLSGKAQYEKGNIERAGELFSKADGVYDEFEWALNTALDGSFDDKAIQELKDGIAWYGGNWSVDAEKTLNDLNGQGYDVGEEWGLVEEMNGIYGDAQNAFNEKHYWKAMELFKGLDKKINAFEDTLGTNNENRRASDLSGQLSDIGEFISGKTADLKNNEYAADWEKNGFNMSDIRTALKAIEDKYAEAKAALDAKEYDKAAGLIEGTNSLIESYDYDYYYGWDVTSQISDLQNSLSEANDWIASASNDSALAGRLAEIKSLYSQASGLVEDADKLYSEGKKGETDAKLGQAYDVEEKMWSKIEEFDAAHNDLEETQNELDNEQYRDINSGVQNNTANITAEEAGVEQ